MSSEVMRHSAAPDLLDRIEELEVRVAFQEDLLGTLNTDVADLHRTVATLREELRRAANHLEGLRGMLSTDAGEEPPPPHY